MQLFCTNRSYLYRFNCISNVYMEMNFIGIVYRCTYLQNLVGWGFGSSSILLYLLSVSELNVILTNPGSKRIYCSNTGFIVYSLQI